VVVFAAAVVAAHTAANKPPMPPDPTIATDCVMRASVAVGGG